MSHEGAPKKLLGAGESSIGDSSSSDSCSQPLSLAIGPRDIPSSSMPTEAQRTVANDGARDEPFPPNSPQKQGRVTARASIRASSAQVYEAASKATPSTRMKNAARGPTFIKTITQHDVLLGRGRPYQDHPGNLRMHRIVNLYREQYCRAPRSDKPIIAKLVMSTVKNEGGARFLRKVDTQQGTQDLWEEVTDDLARDKISHAFRNRARQGPDHIEAREFERQRSLLADQQKIGTSRNSTTALPQQPNAEDSGRLQLHHHAHSTSQFHDAPSPLSPIPQFSLPTTSAASRNTSIRLSAASLTPQHALGDPDLGGEQTLSSILSNPAEPVSAHNYNPALEALLLRSAASTASSSGMQDTMPSTMGLQSSTASQPDAMQRALMQLLLANNNPPSIPTSSLPQAPSAVLSRGDYLFHNSPAATQTHRVFHSTQQTDPARLLRQRQAGQLSHLDQSFLLGNNSASLQQLLLQQHQREQYDLFQSSQQALQHLDTVARLRPAQQEHTPTISTANSYPTSAQQGLSTSLPSYRNRERIADSNHAEGGGGGDEMPQRKNDKNDGKPKAPDP